MALLSSRLFTCFCLSAFQHGLLTAGLLTACSTFADAQAHSAYGSHDFADGHCFQKAKTVRAELPIRQKMNEASRAAERAHAEMEAAKALLYAIGTEAGMSLPPDLAANCTTALKDAFQKHESLQRALHDVRPGSLSPLQKALAAQNASCQALRASVLSLRSAVAAKVKDAEEISAPVVLTGDEKRQVLLPPNGPAYGINGKQEMTLKQTAYLLLSSRRWTENFKRLAALMSDAGAQTEIEAGRLQAEAITNSFDRLDARWMIDFLRREGSDLKSLPAAEVEKRPYIGAASFPTEDATEPASAFLSAAAEEEAKRLEAKYGLSATEIKAATKNVAGFQSQLTLADKCLAEWDGNTAAIGTAQKQASVTAGNAANKNAATAVNAPVDTAASVVPRAVPPAAQAGAATGTRGADAFETCRASGLIPLTATASGVLTEADLAALIRRAQSHLTSPQEGAVTVSNPKAVVSRVQAMAALLKLTFTKEEIASGQSVADSLPPDIKQVPAWARQYVVEAIVQAWWPSERALNPMGPASWYFVANILEKMPLAAGETSAASKNPGAANP